MLAIGLCVASCSFMRVRNLKAITILLWGLFIYDIFWVFYSANIFGENVMVKVASQKASNPIKPVADTFNIPSVDLLDLPMKFICFDMMLGLGDIVFTLLREIFTTS